MDRTSLDWPLSREEKKSQLLRLYNEDVKAADVMLSSGNKALEALREELEAVRCAAGVHKASQKVPDAAKIDSPEHPGTPPTNASNEVERLRQAVESAAAVLRAILPTQDEEDPVSAAGASENSPCSKSRARSEGASREPAAVALRPALCRTPRRSGRSKPKRRVSFGSQPEEEPSHDPENAQRQPVPATAQWHTYEEVVWSHQGAPSEPGHGVHSWSQAGAPAPHPPALGFGCPPSAPSYAPGAPYPGPSYNWQPPSGHGWGSSQGPSYNQSSFGEVPGQQLQQEAMDIFVEVAPETQPNLQRGANGTFEMYVPSVRVKLSTTCNPVPKQYQDLAAFRPFEEFSVALPEVQRVIFDPWANMPPNGRVWCQAHKRGAVIELPPHITMNAKLKTGSPFGSLILEDMSPHGQKVGETVLNYRLQVDGQLAVGHGKGHLGSNRLEVDLSFIFDCYIGGAPVGEPQRIQGPSWSSQGQGYRGPPASGYSGPPGEGASHGWQAQGYGAHAPMNRSSSEGHLSWPRF